MTPSDQHPQQRFGKRSYRTFRQWVKERRRALGLTQKVIADRVGCSQQTLHKIELELRRPSQQLAERLARVLEIPAEEQELFVGLARGIVEQPATSSDKPLTPARGNLPYQLTSFIGREDNLRALETLLDRRRLVTLTGSGGVGKSRLALELAHRRKGHYHHGAWLVDFVPISDPQLVSQTIATAMGLRPRQRDEEEHDALLVSVLQQQHCLIVLDNCEHVLAAAAKVVNSLVQQCPKLVILVTSRQYLGLSGEAVYQVPPLNVPSSDLATDPVYLQSSEAVQLFLEHAASVRHGEYRSSQELQLIAELCRRLDGLPLAIELAARRTNAFSIPELLARLEQRMSLFESAGHTGPPHHQTLHSLIDWSYALLSKDEQCLLRRLQVFPGSWTLDAAEAICGSAPLSPAKVALLLGHLNDKSLVVRDTLQGDSRYRFLETIRQYAKQQRDQHDDPDQLRDQHLSYFLQRAVQGRAHLYDGMQQQWLGFFEAEHDNFRAALEWSLTQSCNNGRLASSMLQLAGILWRFWARQGHILEGRRWMERVRACDTHRHTEDDAPHRVQVLLGNGYLDLINGHSVSGQRLMQQALDVAQTDHPEGVAEALLLLGWATNEVGDSTRADEIFAECLAVARAHDNGYVLGQVLNTLGSRARLGEKGDQAVELYSESLRYFERQQHLSGRVLVLNNMGLLWLNHGNVKKSQALIEEAIALSDRIGDKRYLALAHCSYGVYLAQQGAFDAAVDSVYHGVAIYHQIGDMPGVTNSLIPLAYILSAPPDAVGETACEALLYDAVLFISAMQVKKQSLQGAIVDPDYQKFLDQALERASGRLSPERYAAAWQAGQQQPFDVVVQHALSHYGSQHEAQLDVRSDQRYRQRSLKRSP